MQVSIRAKTNTSLLIPVSKKMIASTKRTQNRQRAIKGFINKKTKIKFMMPCKESGVMLC